MPYMSVCHLSTQLKWSFLPEFGISEKSINWMGVENQPVQHNLFYRYVSQSHWKEVACFFWASCGKVKLPDRIFSEYVQSRTSINSYFQMQSRLSLKLIKRRTKKPCSSTKMIIDYWKDGYRDKWSLLSSTDYCRLLQNKLQVQMARLYW